jgi:hypothetical protein
MNTSLQKTKIHGLPGYYLTDDDFVFSDYSNRKLVRRWIHREWHTALRMPGGRLRIMPHSALHDPNFNPDKFQRTPYPPADSRPIPGFSSYVITHWGAVWRVEPYRNNRWGKRTPFALTEIEHHGSRYYRMTGDNGKLRSIRAQKLLEQVWDDK